MSVEENRAEESFDLVERRIPAGRWHASLGPKLSYRIETREDRLPADTIVRIAIEVRGLRERIDREVTRLRRG